MTDEIEHEHEHEAEAHAKIQGKVMHFERPSSTFAACRTPCQSLRQTTRVSILVGRCLCDCRSLQKKLQRKLHLSQAAIGGS